MRCSVPVGTGEGRRELVQGTLSGPAEVLGGGQQSWGMGVGAEQSGCCCSPGSPSLKAATPVLMIRCYNNNCLFAEWPLALAVGF
jgi:hypothetical protein